MVPPLAQPRLPLTFLPFQQIKHIISRDPGIPLLPQHRGHIAPVIRPVVDHMPQDVGEMRIETAVLRMLDRHLLVRVGRTPQQIAELFGDVGEQPPHLVHGFALRFLRPARDLRKNVLVRNFREHGHKELFEHVHVPERLRHGRKHARHFRKERILWKLF